MARSKALGELSDTELLEMLDQAKDESLNLRFQHVTGQLDNMQLLGRSRKQVARIMTELRAREISTAEAFITRHDRDAEAGEEADDAPDGRARVFKRRRQRDD
jgi:large subunit ribosomal protein L29